LKSIGYLGRRKAEIEVLKERNERETCDSATYPRLGNSTSEITHLLGLKKTERYLLMKGRRAREKTLNGGLGGWERSEEKMVTASSSPSKGDSFLKGYQN